MIQNNKSLAWILASVLTLTALNPAFACTGNRSLQATPSDAWEQNSPFPSPATSSNSDAATTSNAANWHLLEGTPVPIDEENFPDDYFRGYAAAFDLNGDGFLSENECLAVTDISIKFISGISVTSVKGIEFFTDLRRLTLTYNAITELDLSKNVKLEELECTYLKLEDDLDLSNNRELVRLSCDYVYRDFSGTGRNLDLSGNPKLKYFSGVGGVYSLDFSNNPLVEEVRLHGAGLHEVDFTGAVNLKKLSTGLGSQIRHLDLSDCVKLYHLDCSSPKPSGIPWIPYEPGVLETLILNPNATLNQFYCNDNQLTELSFNASRLMMFEAGRNKLEKMDVFIPEEQELILLRFDVEDNKMPYLNLEQITSLYIRQLGPQNVSGYFMKNKDGNWVLDVNQITGQENKTRVHFVEELYNSSYDKESGLLTSSSFPENSTIAYQYDSVKDMKLDVSIKLQQVELFAQDTVYVTQEQAKDEAYVSQIINAEGTCQEEDSSTHPIDQSQLYYEYVKDNGIITSVRTYAVLEDGWNPPIPAETKVILSDIPSISAADIHIRQGDSFRPYEGLFPQASETMEYAVVSSNVNTLTIGAYQILYRVTNNLTHTSREFTRNVYVHGRPVIELQNPVIYRRESSSVQAVLSAVKANAKAYTDFVLPDGNLDRRYLDTHSITYDVSSFVPYTVGEYPVSAEGNDISLLSGPLSSLPIAIGQAECMVNVLENPYSDFADDPINTPPHITFPEASEAPKDEYKNTTEPVLLGLPATPMGGITGPKEPPRPLEPPIQLPKTGDMTKDRYKRIQFVMEQIPSEENGGTMHSGLSDAASQKLSMASGKRKHCILHLILFAVSILEALYYILWQKKLYSRRKGNSSLR